jgi:hypothetical protein
LSLAESGAETPDQTGPGDPFRQRRAGQPAGPDEGRAVGDDKGRVREIAVHRAIGLLGGRRSQDVDVRGHDPATDALVKPTEYAVDDRCLGDGVEPFPRQVDPTTIDSSHESHESGHYLLKT